MEMEKETILKYLNKTVKVQLSNNNVYTLTIKTVDNIDFSAIDKYGMALTISNDSILVIEETKGDNENG